MSLDPTDPRPPYRQIADQLRDAIRGGELSPGDQLPSERELVERYGTAPQTVREAIKVSAGTFERLPDQIGPYGVQEEAELLQIDPHDLKNYPTVGQLRIDLVRLVHAHGQDIAGLAAWQPTTSPRCATTPVPWASPRTVTTGDTAT